MCSLLCHETSDPVCVRFECPANYILREDADTVLCKEKCTKDICCVRDGEASKAFKVNAQYNTILNSTVPVLDTNIEHSVNSSQD